MSAPGIVFLTRALDIGGAERQLAVLAIGLHRSGWQVRVISFYRGGLFEAQLQDAGVPVSCLDKRGRWDILSLPWRLIRIIRRARPDIVHGNMDLPNILLSLLRPLLGRVQVVWWVAASNAAVRYTDWLAWLETRSGALLSRFADLIICNSEAGRRHHVARGYPAARMVVVPNGVETEEFKPDEGARREIRAEWRVPENETLIGIVGRLDPIKDHPNFLRAGAEVAAARPSIRFVCVGDGSAAYRAELRALAGRLGMAERVIWAGERHDMARIYNALDLLVSSSLSEGLPNCVAEAMATGVPCVVTDVGDCAALVGANGWICPPADSSALAGSIRSALAAPSHDRQRSRQRILDSYSTAAMLQRSIAQLGALIGRASGEGIASGHRSGV